MNENIEYRVSLNLMLLTAVPETAPAALLQQSTPAKLNLIIVEGEGAINNVP
jgi:hypothetical protein